MGYTDIRYDEGDERAKRMEEMCGHVTGVKAECSLVVCVAKTPDKFKSAVATVGRASDPEIEGMCAALLANSIRGVLHLAKEIDKPGKPVDKAQFVRRVLRKVREMDSDAIAELAQALKKAKNP